MSNYIHKHDVISIIILFILPLIFFWQVTLGTKTLLPADNLFTFEPYHSFVDEFGIERVQNHLLSDLVLENYVWKRFIRESIAKRELPLWNPYIFAGQPFLANGQHSALYPLTILFYILPLENAYGWFTVIQLWLAGAFTYLFLRVLKANRWGALLAGIVYQLSGWFIFRIVFTMMVAGAVWLPLILAIIEIIIRKQEEKGEQSYSPIPYVTVGAIAVGMQVLAGHVEITYYILLVSAFYAACRLFFMWRKQVGVYGHNTIRLMAWLWVMMVIGLGLGAIQLIPFYEIGTSNFREGTTSLQQVQEWALPMRRIISFVMPNFFGSSAHTEYFDLVSKTWQPFGLNAHGEINPLCNYCATWDVKTAVEAGAYLGILPLILAGLAIYTGVRKSRFPVFIFGTLAILSLLFAFGTPLYALLFYGLPGWNQLHSPFRWIYPFTLSIAVLAGIGVTNLCASKRHDATTSRYVGGLLFWSGLIGMLAMFITFIFPTTLINIGQFVVDHSGLAQNAFADGRQFASYQWRNLLHFFSMVMASGAILRISLVNPSPSKRRGWGGVWKPLMLLIVVMDLMMSSMGFNPAVDPTLLDFTPPAIEWLQAQQKTDSLFRITSFDTSTGRGNKILNANTAMLNQLFDVRGYDSIISKQYLEFMLLIQENGDYLYNRIAPIYQPGYHALDSALLDLLGVRYVLTTETIPNESYRLVYDEEIKIYENIDVMPRAFVVTQSEHDIKDMAFALRSLNPREKVLIQDLGGRGDGQTKNVFENLSCFNNKKVSITEYTNNEVIISAEVFEPSWLVLADSYFPGWKAYISMTNSEEETEITIHRANGNFRAVHLPAGAWQIRFIYTPMSFKLGIYVSFLAGMILMFLFGYWSWGKLYRESETDSPIKRIAKNSLVPMVMALTNRLIDFAFAMVMLRILQPEGAGKFAFAVAFISMSDIITRYGLGTLVTREVAANRTETNSYLSNVTLLRMYLWVFALPFIGTILVLYVMFGDLSFDVVITIAIFSIGMLLSNFADGLTAIFYAHEKAEYPAAIASITTLTRVGVGLLVLLLGWGIIGLAGASLLANLVSFMVLSYILMVKIYRPSFDNDISLQKEMMRESLPLMLNHLLATIFFRIDVFILAPTWGDESVGYYNAAYKYIDGINIIPQYFTLAIFPLMSKFASDSRDSLIRAYKLSLRLLIMLALPITIGTPFVAHELIGFLAGEKFIPDSVIVLQILIFFLPFSFINQVTQYVLIAINQQRFLTRAFVIGVAFNLITNIIFIPKFGYRAAAVTTILSEWVLLIPFYMLVKKHLCTLPWLDIVWRPIVAGLVMGGILWFMGDIGFVMTVVIGGSVYLLVLTLVGGLNQEDMAVVWRQFPK